MNQVQNELMHYGVLGMHWGKRKQQNLEYREKAANVAKNKYAAYSDVKRAKYASQSTGKRIAKTAGSLAMQMVVMDALTGQIINYGHMSKKQIANKVTSLASNTVINLAVNDAMAKSAMKNYTNEGKVVRGTNRSNKLVTKEDLMSAGIGVGIRAAYIGAAVGGMKVAQLRRQRAENEAKFNSWGQNILPQSVDNVIWTNGDMAVIDNKRR